MASKKPKAQTSTSQRSTPPKSQKNYAEDIASFYSSKINYSLLAHPPVTKTIRSYRQELTFLSDPLHSGEFIAYCIMSKQSKSGVFSNERLLVLGSRQKELSYYSQVPTLPLTEVVIKDIPKERIQIDKVGKFSFVYVKNGIGEAIVSWEENGSMNEWRITLGNRRMAKQFAEVVEAVKKDEHITKKLGQSRTIEQKKKQQPENIKINKKVTTFIEEVEKLQQKVVEKQKKKKRMQQQQFEMGEHQQEDLPTKKPQIEERDRSMSVQSPPSIKSAHSNKSHRSKLEANSKTVNLVIEIPISPPINEIPIMKAEVQPITPKLYEKQLPIEQILLNADQQYQQSRKNAFLPLQETSLDRQSKNISELQKALKNRRDGLQSSTAKRLTANGASLSSSKVTVKRIDSLSKEKPSRPEDSYSSVRHQSQYAQNADVIRSSLLEERRHTLNPTVSSMKKQNIPQVQARRESVRSKTQTNSQAVPSGPRWLYRWLTAKDNLQRATLYCEFMDCCTERVKKMSEVFQNWYILNSKAQQVFLEEEGVQYNYVMLNSPQAETKEKDYRYILANCDFMMHKAIQLSSQTKQSYEYLPSGPMACLITYQSLLVLCQTVTTPDLHPQPLQNNAQINHCIQHLSDSFRLMIQPSLFVQLQSSSSKWIYLNQQCILPWIDKEKSQFIDGNFIKQYIKQGVINIEKDIQTVSSYVKMVLGKTVKTIQKERLLSSVQLDQILKQKGLNSSLLVALCKQASERKLEAAQKILLSEIIADKIVYFVRLNVQQYLLTRNTGRLNIAGKVYETIDQWLHKQPNLISSITQKLGSSILTLNPFDKINQEYIVTSVLFKLGLRCEFKRCPALDVLQRLDYNFWEGVSFTPSNINLTFTHQIQHFDGRIFNKDNERLEKIILRDEEPTKQEDIFKMIAAVKQIYGSSPLFRLMPIEHKIAFCSAVAARTAPSLPLLVAPAYELEYYHLYFNLHYHSTAYLLSSRSLAYDLTAIRWLIKEKKLPQARAKLNEQLCRAWIWGRQCPKLLLEVVELQTMFSLLLKSEAESLASSLKSVQIAIACMQQGESGWELVCSKAHQAATLHYQLSRFDQALPLFKTCSELASQTTDPILPQIYRRIAEISLAKGSMQDCLSECQLNLKRYEQWIQSNCTITQTVQTEQFETYLLQFRCYDIQNRKIDKLHLAEQCCRIYINPSKQKDKTSNPPVKHETSKEQDSYRVRQILKIAWQAINDLINCPSPSSKHYLHTHYPKISISHQSIETILLKYRHPRYSHEEMVSYLRRMKRGVVDAMLEGLTSQHLAAQTSIYEENRETGQGLILECVCGLLGIDLAVGFLQASTRNYSFCLTGSV